MSKSPSAMFATNGAELIDSVRSTSVLSDVVQRTDQSRFAVLENGDPLTELRNRLHVVVDPAANRLEIDLESPFPHQAATVVNSVIDSVLAHGGESASGKAGSAVDSGMIVKVEKATADVRPNGWSSTLVILLSAGVGLLLGVAAALYREIIDERVSSPDRVAEATGMLAAGCLTLLPARSSSAARGLAAYIYPGSEIAVQCQLILQLIFGKKAGGRAETLLITCSESGDGCSTAAVNLAATLAGTGASVVLVDANLQSPLLPKLLEKREAMQGLCEALQNPSLALDLVERTHVNHLHLLSCGEPSTTTAALLRGSAMNDVLSNLQKKYNHVLLDSGSVKNNPITLSLASLCKATLLVLHAGRTKISHAEECRKMLNQHGPTTVFAVVNASHRVTSRSSGNESYANIHNFGWIHQKSLV